MAHVATVTIDNGEVDADLTDFPVYIDLSDMPTGFWDTVTNGGGDIRVYKDDDTTELAREVVSCLTASDTGEMHVKFTGTLSSTVDTDIHIYADGSSTEPATTATYGRDAVWSAYEFVTHMDGASTTVSDSTGNGHTGTKQGNTTESTGKLGKAQYFDDTGDYIDVATAISFGTITLSAWAKAVNTTNGTLIGKRVGSENGAVTLDTAGAYRMVIREAGGWYTPTGSTTSGAWRLIHGTYDGSTVELFENGATSGTPASITGSIDTTTNAYKIGRDPGTYGDYYGDMDEVRVKSGALTSTWISTEHSNQSDTSTFYTASAPAAATDNALAWCNF